MSTYKKVDSRQKFPEMEKEVLKFWEENKIFEKSLENRKDSPEYTFYDGPPFATGTPHYGHIVGSLMKDVVPRYWTMRGRYVERKWGWDCHGLPIENIVEKEMGSKKKKDIEEMGVGKFNDMCRSKVLEYVDEWEKVIGRLGRWADMKNAYRTMDKDFMESVWWVFKELYDRGLIYESYRSMHVCPRCETTLSQSEVAEGYRDIKDLSVVARFHVKPDQEWAGGKYKTKNAVYILAWTTTPWTLPGNTALAVGADIDYTALRVDGVKELLIVASERVSELFEGRDIEIVHDDVKGSDLVGLEYEPLFDAYAKDKNLENHENGWKVYAADFVTTEDGTGVVHIAPAFGEDDMNLGKEKNLPFVQHVSMDGTFKSELGDLAGLNVKPIDDHTKTDVEIIKYLAGKGLLFSKKKYEHSYPHCWRCDTPLINYATSSWFVGVTEVKDKALELAKEINWSPSHIKEGRFGNWLEGARDWSISRQRFWASVMPIWKCEGHEAHNMKHGTTCNNIKVFGSVEELEKLSGEKVDDLHKHIVDEITFPCEKCGGTMKRIPDVLDTWFDSGSMPYAQKHYPFENKEKFEKTFPAEFIAEGIDQTRCWFYYLHVIGTAIKEKPAYKNVIVNGIVLAEDGKKMAKKLKNYPDPMEMFEGYGADAVRYYLMSSPVVAAQNLNFSEKDVSEVVRGMMRMLWNSYSFFVMYANIDNFEPKGISNPKSQLSNLLDKWIVSELHTLIRDYNEHMENYELHRASRLLPKFVDQLSNWYIRRSRRRFWKSEDDGDKNEAYETLHYVLTELSKVMAPFMPFVSEEIYRNLKGCASEEGILKQVQDDSVLCSVHLEDFPAHDEKLIDSEVNEKMQLTRDIINNGLQLRSKAGVKVRQPLSELITTSKDLNKELMEIIQEEVNVKKVSVVERIDINENIVTTDLYSEPDDRTAQFDPSKQVALNTEITEDLRLEGLAREVVRAIQQMRKDAGYEVDNRIEVGFETESKVFEKFGDLIFKETLADKNVEGKLEASDLEKEFEVDGERFSVSIKKIL
ncbi:MAG: isoleucine--tRNA ligase [Candidatus Moranbacteria bacterium]|nr:isoleucine--tRNA ligase [Candidatus Moranbacteria bacterium]